MFEGNIVIRDSNEVSFSKIFRRFALGHWVVYLGEAEGGNRGGSMERVSEFAPRTARTASFRKGSFKKGKKR